MSTKRFGLYFGCMDRRLHYRKIDRRLRETLGLAIDPVAIDETAPRRYCYPLTSAGGNDCSGLPKALKIFVAHARKVHGGIQITHAIFFKHTDCAAFSAEEHTPPKDGARVFAQIYSTYRVGAKDVLLVPKPKLVVVRIDTHTSRILEQTDISQEIWLINQPIANHDEWRNLMTELCNIEYPEANKSAPTTNSVN